jgi:LacI family transcriptional regulator
VEQFRQHQVDGLIFVDTWRDPGVFLALEQEQYPPMVFANLRQTVTPYNCVGVDNVRGGYEATRHLLDMGRRKIAHISGPEYWQSSEERVKGYREALDEYGLPYDGSLLEIGDWEVIGGAAALRRLLDRHPDIDALFVSNDLMAAGCIHTATQRGLRIPHDLALVSYDDRRLAEALNPPLTSFALPLNLIGQKAAHQLVDRLLQEEVYLIPSIRVPGGLAIRASCGTSRG